MPTSEQIEKWNSIFADKLGRVPSGKDAGLPAFRWMRSEDLLFLVKKGERSVRQDTPLLSVVQCESICEWERQTDLNAWVVARWLPPPEDHEWKAKYGEAIGRPVNGYWFMIAPLNPENEPDENLTYAIADQLKWQRELTFDQTYSLVMGEQERKKKKQHDDIADMIDQVVTYHVPGARGGSHLSFSEPSSKGVDQISQ